MSEHVVPGGYPDDDPIDPREGLAIVAAQRRRVQDSIGDDRLVFGVWGLAWLVGYGAMWWTADRSATSTSSGLGGLVFACAAAAALAVTLVHVVRSTQGLAGTSSQVGAIYGWAWFVGFLGQGLVTAGVVRAGADDQVVAIVANGVAALVVGLLYMAGGALWRETALVAVGGWMIATAGAASLLPMPSGYLVMALAGGGGMLAAAGYVHLRRRRA